MGGGQPAPWECEPGRDVGRGHCERRHEPTRGRTLSSLQVTQMALGDPRVMPRPGQPSPDRGGEGGATGSQGTEALRLGIAGLEDDARHQLSLCPQSEPPRAAPGLRKDRAVPHAPHVLLHPALLSPWAGTEPCPQWGPRAEKPTPEQGALHPQRL